MKSSLSHLPQTKQDQIRGIAEIIKEVANPQKIILFGSYANGNYTEHRYTGRDGVRYEYISDYDFLVVTKGSVEKAYELEDQVVNRSRKYSPSVNMEIHDIEYINEGLTLGQYFFADIVKEGVVLFDNLEIEFATPRTLSIIEEKEIAIRYFEKWFNRGGEFLIDSKNAFQRGSLNNSVFHLHQSTESFYYTALLVFTGYKPKTHNLAKLRKQAKALSEELYLVFPAETNKKENHLFDLLKRGYVDARYRDDYNINNDELSTLIERVVEMRDIVKDLCTKKIEAFEL